MSVTETIQQQIRNQISSAFGGNPNSLDVTLAKLKQQGKTIAYTTLFNALTGAQGLLGRIEVATGGTVSGDLEPAALTARVNAIAANSVATGYSLAVSAMPAPDSLFAEKNSGTQINALPDGDVFGLYVGGLNTRRLTWNVKQTRTKYAYVNGKLTRVGTVTTTNTVWSDGSGPFVSCLSAAILNLDLIGLASLADELAQLQAAIWSIADEVGVVTIGHDAVPASIVKQYPKGFAIQYDIDNKVIA